MTSRRRVPRGVAIVLVLFLSVLVLAQIVTWSRPVHAAIGNLMWVAWAAALALWVLVFFKALEWADTGRWPRDWPCRLWPARRGAHTGPTPEQTGR